MSLLLNIVLPAIVAVPLALFGALWISPDYDFFGVGPALAGYGLAPSAFGKKTIAQAPPRPMALPTPTAPAVEHETNSPAEPADSADAAATDSPSGEVRLQRIPRPRCPRLLLQSQNRPSPGKNRVPRSPLKNPPTP